MNDIRSGPRRSRPVIGRWWLVPGLAAFAVVFLVRWVHPFLAPTKRVDADVLVVEGWIYDYMMAPSAAEFRQGRYTLLLTSGLEVGGAPGDSFAQRTATRLEAQGVPRNALVACPAALTTNARTVKTARAVRDKLRDLGLHPRGINVITAGPHARETWVAYRHTFGREIPVGIISLPKTNYPPDRWWTSRPGLFWVTKDFIAWLKEVIFGQRARAQFHAVVRPPFSQTRIGSRA